MGMIHVTLNLVFVETALELVPAEILGHPSVRRNAKRRGKRPEETLLDRSLHHYAMTGLPGQEKRGRPDILHFCLLEAMGSPLNRAGGLRVWVSTHRGQLIEIDPSTRLPSSLPTPPKLPPSPYGLWRSRPAPADRQEPPQDIQSHQRKLKFLSGV